jgi:glycosyltransferase involved in cell wall biosynthesis
MEQDVGHAVQASHLCRELARMTDLDWHYIPVSFYSKSGLVEKLKFLPATFRASVRARFEVEAGLAGHQPEALFWNTQKPAVLCQSLVARVPSVMSLDVTPLQYDEMGEEYGHAADRLMPVSRFKHEMNRRVFNLAYRLLPATTWVADSLIDCYGVPPERIEVLPPGTDLERFRPASGKPSDDGARLRVLFVGGDFRRKGGDIVLDWFRTADKDRVELHLVTRDDLEIQPGAFVHRLSHEDAALTTLYQQADVFVLPTRAECFGLVLTEAMACGIPCVTCPVGGLAEVVEDGVTGLHTRAGDLNSFSLAMGSLLADTALRQRLGRAGREAAEERFDARRNVGRIVQILRQAAEEARSESKP